MPRFNPIRLAQKLQLSASEMKYIAYILICLRACFLRTVLHSSYHETRNEPLDCQHGPLPGDDCFILNEAKPCNHASIEGFHLNLVLTCSCLSSLVGFLDGTIRSGSPMLKHAQLRSLDMTFSIFSNVHRAVENCVVNRRSHTDYFIQLARKEGWITNSFGVVWLH